MDPQFIEKLDQVPFWARDWCYFFMLNSALAALTAILTLLVLVFGFSEIYKKGRIGIVFLYIVAFLFQAASSLVMFWMCRSSLKK